uniref:Uncharacterized protein n=1 Tax=Rhizophora mucronata TaxID=61149 RepID=A0A2P2NBI4_RHIMU
MKCISLACMYIVSDRHLASICIVVHHAG